MEGGGDAPDCVRLDVSCATCGCVSVTTWVSLSPPPHRAVGTGHTPILQRTHGPSQRLSQVPDTAGTNIWLVSLFTFPRRNTTTTRAPQPIKRAARSHTSPKVSRSGLTTAVSSTEFRRDTRRYTRGAPVRPCTASMPRVAQVPRAGSVKTTAGSSGSPFKSPMKYVPYRRYTRGR